MTGQGAFNEGIGPVDSTHGPASQAGRLSARPENTARGLKAGLHCLGLAERRDGLIYVPGNLPRSGPHALIVVLHGAGGAARQAIDLLSGPAERLNVVLLAPESRRGTWDILLGEYGADVTFVDRALAQVFDRLEVNRGRLAICGFSDGASYALSLGLINGDLFSHVIGFSPGCMQPTARHGRPRFFISHGVYDTVLPIGGCSRRLVPALQRAGYKVRYEEFGGAHEVPPDISGDALAWFLSDLKS